MFFFCPSHNGIVIVGFDPFLIILCLNSYQRTSSAFMTIKIVHRPDWSRTAPMRIPWTYLIYKWFLWVRNCLVWTPKCRLPPDFSFLNAGHQSLNSRFRVKPMISSARVCLSIVLDTCKYHLKLVGHIIYNTYSQHFPTLLNQTRSGDTPVR